MADTGDVVPLEALRAVDGRERERRVVALQLAAGRRARVSGSWNAAASGSAAAQARSALVSAPSSPASTAAASQRGQQRHGCRTRGCGRATTSTSRGLVEEQAVLLDAVREAELERDRRVRHQLGVGAREDRRAYAPPRATIARPRGQQPARAGHAIAAVGREDERRLPLAARPGSAWRTARGCAPRAAPRDARSPARSGGSSRGPRGAAPEVGAPGRGRAARRRGATRRWSGRRRRRGRCRAARRPAGPPARAASGRGPVPRRRRARLQRAPPSRAGGRRQRRDGRRQGDEVVEVERAALRRARPGSPRRPRCVASIVRGRPAFRVELEAGEGVVEPAQRGVRQRAAGELARGRSCRSTMRVTSTPASAGWRGPRAWNVLNAHAPGRATQLSERRIGALLELLRRATVERQGTDRCGVRAQARRATPAGRRRSWSCRSRRARRRARARGPSWPRLAGQERAAPVVRRPERATGPEQPRSHPRRESSRSGLGPDLARNWLALHYGGVADLCSD